MFGKLRKKIIYSVVLIAFVFILSLSAVSYSLIVASIYNMQKDRADFCATSAVAGCNSYVNAVIGFVENTASKSVIVNAVLHSGEAQATSALNDLRNNSVEIDGVILYGFDGYIAYSAGVGAPPSLDELRQDEGIGEFMSSSATKYVSLRKSGHAGVYNSAYYEEGSGIISCIVKVLDEHQNAVGILVADVLPSTIEEAKLSSYTAFDATAKSQIKRGDAMLSSRANVEDFSVTKKSKITDDAYVSEAEFVNDASIVLRFSLSNFKRQSALTFAILLGVDVLLMAASVLFARRFADNVTNPLGSLLDRMTGYNQDN